MCLGIPMQITAIEGYSAICAAHGVIRTVSLFLLEPDEVTVGDHVLVHVGYALRKLTPERARAAWGLLDQIFPPGDDR